MTSRTITIEFNQFIILITLIIYTVWIWVKSLNVCPPSFSEQYITLHQKYTNLLKEKEKMDKFFVGLNKTTKNDDMQSFDIDEDDDDY